MADFEVKRIPDENSPNGGPVTTIGTTGINEISKRLLGLDGRDALGVGEWLRDHSYWKTFYLYAQDRLEATGVGAAVVEIHACMELPDDPADHDDAAYEVIATLSSGTRFYQAEHPWRYVRAKITTVAAFPVQVGYNAQGGG
jgi:hypothetical protein